jgi:hypothetical protein
MAAQIPDPLLVDAAEAMLTAAGRYHDDARAQGMRTVKGAETQGMCAGLVGASRELLDLPAGADLGECVYRLRGMATALEDIALERGFDCVDGADAWGQALGYGEGAALLESLCAARAAA